MTVWVLYSQDNPLISRFNQTYSFLERVPLGRGISEPEIIKVNGDLSQEVIASKAVIVPDRDPQGAIL